MHAVAFFLLFFLSQRYVSSEFSSTPSTFYKLFKKIRIMSRGSSIQSHVIVRRAVICTAIALANLAALWANELRNLTTLNQSGIISKYKENNQLDDIAQLVWSYSHTVNGITTYRSQTAEGYTCFRGVALADVHISRIMGTFSDASLAPRWITMLKTMVENRSRDMGPDIVYQLYNLPWPVQDRDLVLQRSWVFDAKSKHIEVLYTSTRDQNHPEINGVIRAYTPHTQWKFTQNIKNNMQTIIELESVLDSKGVLPVFLTNFIQSSCPHKIISGLIKLAENNITVPMRSIAGW